ncbi:hypothetical protein B0919_12370 [Hymenobacter sp. CRA2]|nr:hypothetical protein B0919_12370 [Hymenobacter sp. CRA2]
MRDSSRVTGRLWLTPTKAGELLVKTEDDQQFNYTPAQLAYFTFGTAKYITIDFPNEKGSPATRPVFAQVVATGKIEAIRYSFVRNVGGLLVSTLLVRPIGSSAWTSLPENGGLKQLREVVGPLVADQPSFARVLVSGRINYDNLLEYIVSYNGYVAKQP